MHTYNYRFKQVQLYKAMHIRHATQQPGGTTAIALTLFLQKHHQIYT